MIGAISSALAGLSNASQKVAQAAENIANPQNGSELIEDIVDIKVAEVQYKANIQTLKVAEDLTQELLNIFDERV